MATDLSKLQPSTPLSPRPSLADRVPDKTDRLSGSQFKDQLQDLMRPPLPAAAPHVPPPATAASATAAATTTAAPLLPAKPLPTAASGVPHTPVKSMPVTAGPTQASQALAALTGKSLANQGGPEEKSSTSLKFSNHALERIRSRGINIVPHLDRIEKAVERAAQKGSRETLVLTDNSALIVNVKSRTVVTAMDRAMMKENIFTNIDSTVMV